MNNTPSFRFPTEVPAELRQQAEKSLKQTGAVLVRGFELAQQNTAVAIDHAQSLVRAGSVQDALKLQAEFIKERLAAAQIQAKELYTLAQPSKAA